MKVTVLGNNGPFPAAGGACSSYLVEADGVRVLVDAGSGSMSNLMKLIGPDELDAIFLSHLHWDHMTDIPVLFYYLHVMSLQGKDIRQIPLYLPECPAGAYNIIKGFDKFIVKELNEESKISIGNIEITARLMTHPVESYALRFKKGERSLVYTGDTTFNPDISRFAKSCNLLITDSGFLKHQLNSSSPHMSAEQCAVAATDAGTDKLLLSHLNPYTDVADYLREAKEIFEETYAAELMTTLEV